MSKKYDGSFDALKQAIEEDRLLLPTLPEVALKIRDVVEKENTTTEQIADILSQDAALSVRLLKVVNSPLYRADVPIDDLHTAVTRMGGRLVRDLIINLAIKQMFQPTFQVMNKQFRKAWSTSVNVAAICQMMAVPVPGIRKEQALLAGLIHNIGALPLLMMAENDKDLANDSAELDSIIHALQGRVGVLMLKSWNFPDSLIEVVAECHNFNYDQKGDANLVNLVQVALLQGGYIDDEPVAENWSSLPSLSKLGMDTDINIVHIEENQEILDSARKSLMV